MMIAAFDRLHTLRECLLQDAFADESEDEAEQPAPEVLPITDDGDVDVGRSVWLPREVVRVAGRATPDVRIGRGEDDVIGIGPVVVQALPDAARSLGDVGIGGASLMFEEPLAAKRAELERWRSLSESLSFESQ